MANRLLPMEMSGLPSLIQEAGPAAKFAWEEFIYGKIRNRHTRAAYERAIRQFLRHCDRQCKELPTITPMDVGTYLDGLAVRDVYEEIALGRATTLLRCTGHQACRRSQSSRFGAR